MERVYRRKRIGRQIPEDEVITLENVTKSYSTGAPALNGVTLHIKRGEFVFIVGDSGSGKSTLIKLLLREMTCAEMSGLDLGKRRSNSLALIRSHVAACAEFTSCRRINRAGDISLENDLLLVSRIRIRCRNR